MKAGHLLTLVCLLLLASVSAQTESTKRTCGLKAPQVCIRDVLKDQAGIWSSPGRVKSHDLLWIAPFAAATGVSIHYDADALRAVGNDSTRAHDFRTASDVTGLYIPLTTAGATYILGAATHDAHLRETGVLSGEAMLDALLVTEPLKFATNRQRPDQGDHAGKFWPHGTNHYPSGLSFPSGHAASAWAFAHVIAAEYPRWPVRIAVYSLAATVSATRVMGRAHFPSDVLVGSTFGYLIGGYVYNHRSERSTHQVSVTPLLERKAYGIALSFR